MNTDTSSEHEKIMFELERDEDGYPPNDFPSFVKGVSLGDTVSAMWKGNEWRFERLMGSEAHSTIRVIFHDVGKLQAVREFARRWLYRRPCEMRKSYDGLSGRARTLRETRGFSSQASKVKRLLEPVFGEHSTIRIWRTAAAIS